MGSAQLHIHALRGPEALACPSPPAGQTEEGFEEWSRVHPALCLPWAHWALPSCVGLGMGLCADCPLLLLLGWQRKDILAELSKSQKVFSEKLDHLSRRLAWVHAAVYSQVSRGPRPVAAPSAGSWAGHWLGRVLLASGTHLPPPTSSGSVPPHAITPIFSCP